MKTLSSIIVFISIIGVITVCCSLPQQPIIKADISNTDSLRIEMRKIIFNTNNIFNYMPDSIYKIGNNKEKFVVLQKNGINSNGIIFYPKTPNYRLIIYHQGHNGSFNLGKKTINYFLEKGFTVYAFSMPLIAENKIKEFKDHNSMDKLKFPLQYFIKPVIAMINYAEPLFEDITMVGISGGGWTTTLCAAIDTRIKYSFPVAGTYPVYVRKMQPKSIGDFEQTYKPLLSKVNYLDMYVMGSDSGRYQLQILNKYDPCCFYGDYYKLYENEISTNFKVFSDATHKEHKISDLALKEIFNTIKNDL